MTNGGVPVRNNIVPYKLFHWIDKEKQPLLLRQVNRTLKLHEQLVCEFGGKGYVAMVHASLKISFEKRYGLCLFFLFPFNW